MNQPPSSPNANQPTSLQTPKRSALTQFFKANHWKEITTLTLSLIGAFAWLSPYVYEQFKKPQVEGKLISLSSVLNTSFSSEEGEVEGIGYYPRIGFTSVNGNFPVKKVEVFITFEGDKNKYQGVVISARELGRGVKITPDGKKISRILQVPPTEHVRSMVVLQPSQVQIVFVPFIVARKYAPFTEMEFHVYDFENNHSSFVISKQDIDSRSILLDDQYWHDAPEEKSNKFKVQPVLKGESKTP
ncbi:MAG: hypothetical protein RM368_02580 [Nostoc sp. DedSLP03]|uniref:hypothetical protein n=1 Tax=Nostoc sp. DedSLP03 TaxID=3075400 RepID=UPI002AD55CB3|nr:hypothetical protein [Nostoc sp. DedSLP03]MDZ7963850.1 hypothetical protein [Nostoc sp. DedSLP03]